MQEETGRVRRRNECSMRDGGKVEEILKEKQLMNGGRRERVALRCKICLRCSNLTILSENYTIQSHQLRPRSNLVVACKISRSPVGASAILFLYSLLSAPFVVMLLEKEKFRPSTRPISLASLPVPNPELWKRRPKSTK